MSTAIGIIAASGAVAGDPLAGIPFLLRLQTHRGDGVPFSIYTDVAGTVPATSQGDAIAAWRDEQGESGLMLTQSDETKRPTLNLVSGVPELMFDGVDDYLRLEGAPIANQPDTIFVGCRFANTNDSFMVDGTGGNRQAVWIVGGSFALFAGEVAQFGAANTDYHAFTALFNSSSSSLRVDGTTIDTASTGGASLVGITLGCAGDNPPAGVVFGQMVAVLLQDGETADPQRTTIENYIASLIP